MVGPPIRWFLLTVALSLVAELPLAGARRGALPVSSPPRRRGGGGAAHQAVHAAREAMAAAELKSPDRLQTENPGGPKSEKEPELEHEHHKYIIIGAGPGGLQLAHYLHAAGRDYVVLDRAATAGNFFQDFPRYRKLISVNKRFTGSEHLDFNLRFDWNSLLSDPSHHRPFSHNSDNVESCSSGQCTARGRECSDVDGCGPEKTDCWSWSSPDATVPHRVVDNSDLDVNLNSSFVPHPKLLFRSWSEDYFPKADDLEAYLKWYANYHRLSIRYGNDVVEIRDYVAQARDEGNDESPVQGHGASDSMHWSGDDADATLRVARRPRFEIEVVDQQSHSTVLFSSDVLVIATGLTPQYVGGITPRTNDGNKSASSKAHAVPISISRVVANLDVLGEDYSTFNTTLSGFENKRVALLGWGNSAFEVASNIMERTHLTAMTGLRRPDNNDKSLFGGDGQLRLAWQTHYPGDVRAVYNNVLESYLLKTGDILASTVVAEYDPDDVSGNSRPSRRLPPRSSAFRNSSTGLLHFVIQPHAPVRRNQSRNRLVYLPPAFKKCIKHLQAALSGAAGSKNITFDDALDTYQRLYDEPPLEDNPLFHEACTRIRFSEQGFHRIIVNLGWRPRIPPLSPRLAKLLNTSALRTGRGQARYPKMTPHFESQSVPGLYFAGAIMHGNDFHRAAGGFIHGFRYLVRSLHRSLEMNEEFSLTEMPPGDPVRLERRTKRSRNHGRAVVAREEETLQKTRFAITPQEKVARLLELRQLLKEKKSAAAQARRAARATPWPVTLFRNTTMSVVREDMASDSRSDTNLLSQMNLHCLRSRREHPDCMPPMRISRLAQHVGEHIDPVKDVQEELNKIADDIVTRLLYRMNHASGLFQMFGELQDLVVVSARMDGNVIGSGAKSDLHLMAMYLEEVPLATNLTSFLARQSELLQVEADNELSNASSTRLQAKGAGRGVVLRATLEYGHCERDDGSLCDPFHPDRSARPHKPHTSLFLHPVLRLCAFGSSVVGNSVGELTSCSEPLPPVRTSSHSDFDHKSDRPQSPETDSIHTVHLLEDVHSRFTDAWYHRGPAIRTLRSQLVHAIALELRAEGLLTSLDADGEESPPSTAAPPPSTAAPPPSTAAPPPSTAVPQSKAEPPSTEAAPVASLEVTARHELSHDHPTDKVLGRRVDPCPVDAAVVRDAVNDALEYARDVYHPHISLCGMQDAVAGHRPSTDFFVFLPQRQTSTLNVSRGPASSCDGLCAGLGAFFQPAALISPVAADGTASIEAATEAGNSLPTDLRSLSARTRCERACWAHPEESKCRCVSPPGMVMHLCPDNTYQDATATAGRVCHCSVNFHETGL